MTDYFSKEEGKIAKFYFIVDRLDLAEQAKNEFEARGLKVKLIKDKEEFIADITNPGESNTSGKVTMTVINIQKFSKDSVTIMWMYREFTSWMRHIGVIIQQDHFWQILWHLIEMRCR